MTNKTWRGKPIRYGVPSADIRKAKKLRGECATYSAVVCLGIPEEGMVTCLPCSDKRKTYLNKWREQNRERVNKYARENAPPYSPRRGEVNWYSYVKVNFGLSKSEVDQMLANQGYVCAICKRPNNQKDKRLSLDHNHSTGKARAFLCHRCNSVLGWMEESVENLQNMIEYIIKYTEID